MIRLRGRPLDITVIQCYAPTAECSEEEIEKFYQQLDQAVSQCKSQDIRVVMGDLNAKVGEGKKRKHRRELWTQRSKRPRRNVHRMV